MVVAMVVVVVVVVVLYHPVTGIYRKAIFGRTLRRRTITLTSHHIPSTSLTYRLYPVPTVLTSE